MPGDKVKASAIFAEAFRLEGEVKRLQEALAAANAELAVWRDEDAREAKYEHVSQRCTKAEESLATALRERDAAKDRVSQLTSVVYERGQQIALERERFTKERDSLRAEVQRLREATTRLIAVLDSPFVNVEATATTAAELTGAMSQARAALATGGDR